MTKDLDADHWSRIIMIMNEELPDFKKMCDEDANEIILHTDAFSTELGDLALLGIAIKYATVVGKDVKVIHHDK